MFTIAKKSNPLNPVQWNILAIIFVLGFMPFAVAFISNAGSSSDEAWNNSMQLHDEPIPLNDDSIWVENGGSNLTSWYSTYHPPSNNDELDCSYITNGECEGFYDDTNPTDRLIKPLSSSQPLPTPNNAFISNDYFEVRSSQITQSHFEPANGNAYAGRSGSEVFSWYLSEKFNNEIDQNDTVDSLRYWMTSSTSYSCSSNIFNNLTFEGEIEFYYGNDSKKFSNFEFSKDNKFEYSAFDDSTGSWSSVCAVGFFIEFDFTGFERLELHSFNGRGDWDNTSIKLTLRNFVNQESPDDFGSTALPFAGGDYWNLGVQHKETNPVEAGFLIKSGTLILAVITLAVALASTPYWDPFRNFFKGMVD